MTATMPKVHWPTFAVVLVLVLALLGVYHLAHKH
jgi:hypothetical protein